MCPRQESDLHLLVRSEPFYPLNYKGNIDQTMWTVPDSNRRPLPCHGSALPTVLTARLFCIVSLFYLTVKPKNYFIKFLLTLYHTVFFTFRQCCFLTFHPGHKIKCTPFILLLYSHILIL